MTNNVSLVCYIYRKCHSGVQDDIFCICNADISNQPLSHKCVVVQITQETIDVPSPCLNQKLSLSHLTVANPFSLH